jgi:glycosyltransferase involved in cell wall biosynthesis
VTDVGADGRDESRVVSVITPVYNGERTLPALIRALSPQLKPFTDARGPVAVEWLVVDNGSTDRSRSILESANVVEMRILDESKRGPSAARNRGLREARGECVAMLDADCVPTSHWLREIVDPFSDTSVILVAGALSSFPPRTAAQRFAANYGLNDATRMVAMPQMPFANTRNMAVRRDAALAVGGFPEDLRAGEDVEFSYLVRKRFDCPITYRPNAMSFHQDREDDEALIAQATSYGRSMATLYARHPDILRWGIPERTRRFKTTAARGISARLRPLGNRFGYGTEAKTEFAQYLALWTRHFWSGFDAERSSAAPR